MKSGRFFEKGIIFRLLFTAILTGMVILLIHAERSPREERAGEKKERTDELLRGIDRGVDSVLAGFGIEPASTRKRIITVPNSGTSRTERRVPVPPEVPSVEVNAALNSLAKAFGGRAVGSENAKERTVTIHLEIGRIIVESVILKPEAGLRRKGRAVPGR